MKYLLISSLLVCTLLFIPIFIHCKAKNLRIGSKAPDFSAIDHNGNPFSFSEFQKANPGKRIVISFYPSSKSLSLVCKKQACAIQNGFEKLNNANTIVLFINSESPRIHKNWALENRLNFPVLSDLYNQATKAYHAANWFTTLRKTFLIDSSGTIVAIIQDFTDASEHSPEKILAKFGNSK